VDKIFAKIAINAFIIKVKEKIMSDVLFYKIKYSSFFMRISLNIFNLFFHNYKKKSMKALLKKT